MIMRATPLAFSLATLIAWILFLDILVDRAELFVAAIPLAVGLTSLVPARRMPRFELRQRISADRLSEGDRIVVSLTVSALDPIPMIEILTVLPALVELEAGHNRVVLAAEAGQEVGSSFQVACPARGRFDLGVIYIRLWDRSGLSVIEMRRATSRPISVYPAVARIRRVPQPVRTQFSIGNYVSPRLGEGIEPGEIRRFLPGDRTRHINWRASLRRGQLYVTQFHEERNADVVLLLDALSETGAAPHSTLDLSVRAAAGIANAYLARKDRVGFVEFGAFLRWIDPATGRRQSDVLAEGLLPAATHFSYVVPQLDRLPGRMLPRQALVIALTPLLDERFVTAVIDLMARGFDVIVLAISPIESTQRVLGRSPANDIACRLWEIEWREKADALRRRGLAILEWHPDMALEAALAPLARSRPRWAARR
ncbi:MAG TPA: DUF58 domain-containing protein [Stellaceae bacterium]|nr:DUF58 domain-containing protein [Stellaceae bacterium]HUC09456.1 DUF58 domain-containing protein [Stellaceae bacterium]